MEGQFCLNFKMQFQAIPDRHVFNSAFVMDYMHNDDALIDSHGAEVLGLVISS